MIAFSERRRFVLNYLRERPDGSWLDILNSEFVDTYCEATGAAVRIQPYGANKCALLALDLRKMAHEGSLDRHRTGITGMAGMGFPSWVWTYKLGKREHLWKPITPPLESVDRPNPSEKGER